MDLLQDALTFFFLTIGGFFYFVGGLGLLRMPDVFTRMHAVSVSETVGTGFLLFGMSLQSGFSLVSVKLILIFFVLMVVAPVSSHALARAALHDGKLPLLANSKGWLVETDCTDLFPELGARLREPKVSEQVEGEAQLPAVRDPGAGGYPHALEGDTGVRPRGTGEVPS